MMIALKYVVPNGFTALSMLFGLASVAMSAAGDYTLAAWMILWGVLLDKLDGTAARLLDASSKFGMQFDSFADFVVFGIAPAGLFYFRCRELPAFEGEAARMLLMAALGLYVVATSGRLARFNISDPPGGDSTFYGIPTTFCGAVLALSYLTWDRYGLDPSLLTAAPVVLIAAGLAMVSNIRLPKLKGRKNKAIQWFQIANIAAVYAMAPFKLFPEYMLFLCVLYIVVGGTWAAFHPPPELVAQREQAA
ncbi:MAG: CDP-alcohol phosphatidyltransferase family protein [Myxococcales bacterium]|nr:CDP-alcohol phosphatidyltransferase family protein [Myxococcales bacterium]